MLCEWSFMIFWYNEILLNIFSVLPAWRMEAVQGQEGTHVLYRCADRYRFRQTLLLLPHVLRGWGQSAGKTETHAHTLTWRWVRSWAKLSFNIFVWVNFENFLFFISLSILSDSLVFFRVTGGCSLCQNSLLWRFSVHQSAKTITDNESLLYRCFRTVGVNKSTIRNLTKTYK